MVSQSHSWSFQKLRDPRDRVPFRSRSFTPPGFCVTCRWALTSMAVPSWMKASGSIQNATIDRLLSRVARSRLEAAMQDVARQAPAINRTSLAAPSRALEALSSADAPQSLAMVEDMLATHGLSLGEPLGAGMESLVFAARPRTGTEQHVLKVSVDLPRFHGAPFQSLDSVPGIAPYWAKDRFGPLHAALQPRARAVLPRQLPAEAIERGDGRRWRAIAGRLSKSLGDRGYGWTDDIPQNMGLMDDGNWAVIDGTVMPGQPSVPEVLIPTSGGLVWQTLPSRRPRRSAEDAIRALRMTPDDEQLLRRTVPTYGQ